MPFALASIVLAGCGGGGPASGPSGPATGVAAASPTAATALPLGTRTDRVLVRPTSLLGVASLLLSYESALLGRVTGTGWVVASVPSGTSAVAFVSRLESDLRVVACSLDYGMRGPEGNGSTIPAGGLLLANAIATQEELERIGLPAARARATGAGVRVAVLDTGILADHDGVEGQVEAGGYDFVDGDSDPTDRTDGIDEDGDGYVDEDYSHGTFVASLVLAVAPDATVLPYRVLTAEGYGTSSAVAAAIGSAVQAGVKAINLSVAVPPEVEVVQEAVTNARLAGVQVIASAGNTGQDDCGLPSAVANAVVVTSVDAGDVRADFASAGAAVDLSAPGVDLIGAYPPDPHTAIWSGTSFSTAIVTGAFALVRGQHPLWTLDECVDRLLSSTVSVAAQNPGSEGLLGVGRIDLDLVTR